MVTGDLVGGRYRLGDRIGQGGTSVVYRGWDERLGRPVAVKALRADLAGDSSYRIRFRRAAQSAATLITRRSWRSTTAGRPPPRAARCRTP